MQHIKHYTELPYVLQVLQTRRLTLINPNAWNDKNDSHLVETYRKRKGVGSVLAMCLTEATQTYHHWKIFTHGSSGACIFFDKEKLLSWISDDGLITGRNVIYQTLSQIRIRSPLVDELPFLKRKAYQHEAEFRLLYEAKTKSVPFKSFVLPIDTIAGIYLNPWLPTATFEAVKKIINKIEGFENLEVLRSSIVQNDEWQKIAAEIPEI